MNIFELIGTISLEGAEAVGNQINSIGFSMQNAGNNISNFGSSLIDKVTKPIIGLAQSSVMLASDLEEVANVVNTTFGKSGAEVIAWSKTLADKYGLVQLESQKYVGSMGAMLKSSGVSADASKNMSQRLVELTGDMSSFYNLSHDEVWEKIRSGIAGETEPLKALGIDMSVANLEAYALAKGIKKPWKEMTASEKTQLRYNYLMKQTADAQGDFERTSGGFANQLRIVQGKLSEISLAFGQMLLPYALKAIEFISGLVDKFKALDENARKIIIVVALVAAALGPIILIIGGVITAIGVFISSIGTIISVIGMISGPVLGVIVAITALVAIFTAIGAVIGYVMYRTGALQALWSLLMGIFVIAKPIVMDLVSQGIEKFHQAMALVKKIFDDVIPVVQPFLLDTILKARPIIMDIVRALGEFGSAVFEHLGKKIQEAKVIWDAVWPYLRPIVENELSKIKTVILTVLDVIKSIIKTATALIKGDWSAVWSNIADIFTKMWAGIVTVAKKQAAFMKEVGKDIIDGLISGIKSMAGKAADAMGKIVQSLPAGVKKLLGISSPSKVFASIGENMMQGLSMGLENAKDLVNDTLENISTNLGADININKNINSADNGIGNNSLINNVTNVINNYLNVNFDDIDDIVKLKNFLNQIKVEAVTRGGVV